MLNPMPFHRHNLSHGRRLGNDEQGNTAAAGDVQGFRPKTAPTLRPIQPKEPIVEDVGRSEELTAAIARGLPKRRRGRHRRPKVVPDPRGISKAAGPGSAQHPGPSPVGDDGVEADLDDAAAERGDAPGDAHVVRQSSPELPHPAACEEANQPPSREGATDPRQPRRQGKRERLPSREERPRKQVRIGVGRPRRRELQAEELVTVLRVLEEDFATKERLSNDQTWCTPIPHERKVSTVRAFYQAFHDASTLPIRTCMVCYRKRTGQELKEIVWDQWLPSFVPKSGYSPFSCGSCFPEGESVPVCAECARCLERGSLSPAVHLHGRLGCEHMFPDELKGLTLVEEKLIALNSCYGFVTRYSIPGGQRQTVRYPRHVKGHITVFPNNVQELATKVLPHPLLRVMDEIHVSWQGLEKPGPSDLSSLLSVRRQVVERALIWLTTNNPHYADIEIDGAEMESWGTPSHGVPSVVYDRMERNEPSAWEKTRTAQVVPPTERAMDDEGSVEIEEILAALHPGEDSPRCETEGPGEKEAYESRPESDAEPDLTMKPINEVTSSGMFTLDGPPDVADVDKLRFACAAVGEGAGNGHRGPSTWVGSSTEGQRGHVDSSEPYIHVRRGDDFADAFEASFFAKTFPTLLPFGVGGPRLVEEASLESGRSPAGMFGAEAVARDLLSSRNMSLRTWADIVLRRHGGRFATHHIFAFLVFNMGVRSRNRRVSMLSVTRRDFRKVERTVRSLTADRLAAARAELEGSGKTTDEDVKELLRSLSLYGYRQPMSRELRLSMRHKIQALIVRYGVPAIWFTINPNDITNPVKLRLAAYRTRDPEAAEEFLRRLDVSLKRMQLSVSDPMSSATFFHREMTLFFEHYVKVGEESVFGRISQYYGAVETNERGALHVHGLLWLHGNAHLSSMLADTDGEDQAAYRERIVQYIDSVFCEVMTLTRPELPVGTRDSTDMVNRI
jgi:hypothetical protein